MENKEEFNQEFWDAVGRQVTGEDKSISTPSEYIEVKQIWEESASYIYAETEQNDQQWNLLKSKMQIETPQPILKVSHNRNWLKWSAAAAILISVGMGTFMFVGKNKADYTVAVFEYQGKAGQNTNVQLPDGSTVLLRGNSSIKVAKDFGSETRSVALIGEGKFEIAKDADHPFVVEAAGTKTTVLGTGFDINTFDANTIKIQVLHGKVSFKSEKNPAEEAILELGDGANFVAQSNKIESANNANMTQWQKGIIEFNNAKLSDIALEFEATYGRKLIYPAASANSTFSGTLVTSNSPDVFADVLSVAKQIPVSIK